MDFNDAPEQMQSGIIPDGSYVHVKAAIRPGGIDGPETIDKGILTASGSSDVLMLDFEFTVLPGRYAKRKIWSKFTVSGGKLDDKGVSKAWNISKARLCAMIESAMAIHPNDRSPDAKLKRQVRGFADFDGIEFYAKLGVEEKEGYSARNTIDYIVTPADAEYEPLRAGKEVEAKPNGPRSTKAKGATASAPAWGAATAQGTLTGVASPPPPPAISAGRPAWAK